MGDLKYSLIHAQTSLIRKLQDFSGILVVVSKGHMTSDALIAVGFADIVIAQDQATFSFPEVKRGLVPGMVSLAAKQRLPEHACRRLMLTGEQIDVPVAMKLGLVDYEVAQDWDVEKKAFLMRLRRTQKHLLSTIKTSLPVKSIEDASVIMSSLIFGEYDIDDKGGDDLIALSVDGSIACIELRTRHLTFAFASRFRSIVMSLQQDANIESVIIWSSEEHFSTGGRLSGEESHDAFMKKEVPELALMLYTFYTSFSCIQSLKVPLFAAVQGKLIGAGVSLSLWFDSRISSDTTSFQVNFLNLSLSPGLGMTGTYPGVTSWRDMAYLLYSNTELTAENAKDLCMVSSVHSSKSTDLLREAKEIVRNTLATFSRSSAYASVFRRHVSLDVLRREAWIQAQTFVHEKSKSHKKIRLRPRFCLLELQTLESVAFMSTFPSLLCLRRILKSTTTVRGSTRMAWARKLCRAARIMRTPSPLP